MSYLNFARKREKFTLWAKRPVGAAKSEYCAFQCNIQVILIPIKLFF